MKKIRNRIKNNMVIIICIIVFISTIFYSFCDYIHKYYSYDYEKMVEIYEQSQKKCNSGEKINKEYCDNLSYPLTYAEQFRLLDAKTLFFIVAYEHFSGFVCLLVPLLVMIIFLNLIHKDFSSGMVRNIMMRESLKKYKREINKKTLKISLCIPLFVFLLFIISCILTRFNFKVQSSVYEIAVYVKWNYDNIFLYLIICYITFIFLCIFYCNIACCFINKNKNIFIVTIISYLCWIVLCIITTYIEPLIIPPNHFIGRFFNILDYWDLGTYLSKCWYGYIVSAMILALVSYLVREFVLRNKEKVIIENEKGII